MSCNLATCTKMAAVVLVTAMLSGCASSDNIAFTSDRDGLEQKYPANYRPEILAFLRTYLNDPRAVREAAIAEPVQRTVGSRARYVACLRYNARGADGGYAGVKERGALFVEGRLDRMIEKADEVCEGATYAAFPEMEKMTR